jgi:hypothetical protein
VLLKPIDDHTGADSLARNLRVKLARLALAPYAYGGSTRWHQVTRSIGNQPVTKYIVYYHHSTQVASIFNSLRHNPVRSAGFGKPTQPGIFIARLHSLARLTARSLR